MKKSAQKQQNTKKKVNKPTARSARSARSTKDPRWSFELSKTEWGPFRLGGLKMGSRSVPTQGLGYKAIDIQRSMPRLATSMNENGNVVDVLTGTDLLGTIESGSEAGVESKVGDILFKQEISPSKFLKTRLLQFADLYQRYRFKKVRFVYEPIANATQSGQLLGFADFDVDSPLETNSSDNLEIGAAHQGQEITQIWQPMVFDMGQVITFTDLYTEAGTAEITDKRLSVQGIFYILAASGIPAGIPLGNIYVDYEIEFSIPFLSVTKSSEITQSHWYGTLLYDSSYNSGVWLAGQTAKFGSTSEKTSRGSLTVSQAVGDTNTTIRFGGLALNDTLWVSLTVFPERVSGDSADSQAAVLGTLNNPTITGGVLVSNTLPATDLSWWQVRGGGSVPVGCISLNYRILCNPGSDGVVSMAIVPLRDFTAPVGSLTAISESLAVTQRRERAAQKRASTPDAIIQAEIQHLRQQICEITTRLRNAGADPDLPPKDDTNYLNCLPPRPLRALPMVEDRHRADSQGGSSTPDSLRATGRWAEARPI